MTARSSRSSRKPCGASSISDAEYGREMHESRDFDSAVIKGYYICSDTPLEVVSRSRVDFPFYYFCIPSTEGRGHMPKDRNSVRASLLYGLIIGAVDVCAATGVILISDYNRSLFLLAFLLLMIVLIRLPVCVHRYSNGVLITMGSAVLTFLFFELIITCFAVPARLERLLGITYTSTGDGSGGLMLLFFLVMIVVLDILFSVIALLRRCGDSYDYRSIRTPDSR